MATIGNTGATLQDVAKRLDANGKIDKIVELLVQKNEILEDMAWFEGNLPTGHKTTVRTGLPAATWRKLNYGVQPSKSTTAQITDTCGMLEAYAEVDKSLADLNGNSAAFRLSEDAAFIEGMNIEQAKTLIYGDESTPEKFVGIAPRYNLKSAASGANIIDGGGTGSVNSSVFLATWGEKTAHGIYPKGSKAGLSHQDLGEQTLIDAAGGKYQGYRTHYKWDCGLTVRDWRYIVRIANLDMTNMITAGDGTDNSANLIKFMSQAMDTLPDTSSGKLAFYMNAKMISMLRVKLMNKGNVFLTMADYMGKPNVLQFMGVPIRRVDQILNTEARVV